MTTLFIQTQAAITRQKSTMVGKTFRLNESPRNRCFKAWNPSDLDVLGVEASYLIAVEYQEFKDERHARSLVRADRELKMLVDKLTEHS